MNINIEDLIFSLDIGTRTVIGTVGSIKDKKFSVIAEKHTEHEERAMVDGQIHDINLVARAVNKVKSQIEEELGFELKDVAIAAAGRFLRTTAVRSELNIDEDKEIDKDVIRGLELTAVKKAQDEVNKETEGKLYCVGYSVKNYFLNGYAISNLLSHKGNSIAVDVIATFLPRSIVESLYAVMNKVNLNVKSLTLEPIAAMEAAVPKNLRLLNIALLDVGAGTSDIAISSKDTISAYGMVPFAGDEITEVIAQNYLVDFNTAENIKRSCNVDTEIKYTDVLGIENTIKSEEVIKLIQPTVQKLAEEVANKIIELNGEKSPNAVFIVGGGAHTPMLKDLLAENLKIQPQRLAIKGRESVTDCICTDNSLGSTGVTVLGIALVAIRRFGNDFIDVILNDNIISLFNARVHTVKDVVVQAGVNPKLLIGKNGKNVRFILNGVKRVAFGTVAKNAEIRINGLIANIDSEVKENDKIEIKYAENGIDASPIIKDYVKNLYSLGFFIDDEVVNLEPIFIINGNKVTIDTEISEGDEVETVYPSKLIHYIRYYDSDLNKEYYINNIKLDENYDIKEGDRIYTKPKEEEQEVEIIPLAEEDKEEQEVVSHPKEIEKEDDDVNTIVVVVNGNPIKMSGKEKYKFVDIFDYFKFDLTQVKGNLVLTLNGEKVSFFDELHDKDIIEVKWE
ncbi:cell division protein FtsA [Clostridium acetobutylicum]|uniref:FTSA related protein, predicted ATPases of the HSP70 family n=1 Tax=Clostridium acetobutylicum (strain ATCC 824 / DSM 792 / JCM 1419 / IAM 19013 / LMG 5710 / NBRC 13948 / NRRL B-527 / VKM B-1787 / 2291 / W) TaxID=272562 RepID=Q97KA6_CLOAB|nr:MULTISPECIES: cell division protein FtsA [Clostridium]AAK78989.1 FTSA related protein, predicted ATPases of the HSP70 family [Clostridium acetobutylicum ATCC 824]ADZ20064.1 FTSA related protein, predicted ATPase of the HSP70 family [Clostridium acetobutylicum EA 2018]AEI31555.1 HSP70 family ATPase [Clostridium acetobutylicum DSM 1731]AWV81754.1 cell division protein FtsA [Clostridium acetobutylicum]KHD35628.1 cell division protein FtsA [Clostridium acetobutylicum]